MFVYTTVTNEHCNGIGPSAPPLGVTTLNHSLSWFFFLVIFLLYSASWKSQDSFCHCLSNKKSQFIFLYSLGSNMERFIVVARVKPVTKSTICCLSSDLAMSMALNKWSYLALIPMKTLKRTFTVTRPLWNGILCLSLTLSNIILVNVGSDSLTSILLELLTSCQQLLYL